MKVWLRREDPFPRCLTHMAVGRRPQFPTESWQEANVPATWASPHSMELTAPDPAT